MTRNWAEVFTGGIVLLIAVVFTVVGFQRAGFSGGSDNYELQASFRSIEGVALGTDVRLAGVKIGSVTGINLNPQTFRAVIGYFNALGHGHSDISAKGLRVQGQPGDTADFDPSQAHICAHRYAFDRSETSAQVVGI